MDIAIRGYSLRATYACSSLAEPDPHANGGLGTYAIISRAKGMQLKAQKNKISRNYITFYIM